MRKFTFDCFSWKFAFSLLKAFSVSKIAKRSEMSRIFLSGEANLPKKASSSFCLHRQSGKTWADKSFSWHVGEKKERKTRLGGGYNLAIAREKKEKRNTWALTHPERNYWWFCSSLRYKGLALPCEEKKGKKNTFSFHAQDRVWTNGKTGCQSCLRSRSHGRGPVPVSAAYY